MTKPPLPALDGGRLAAAATLEALAAAGVEVTLVAPTLGAAQGVPSPPGVRTLLVPSSPHGWWRAAWRSARSGRPLSVERHASTAVLACVADLVQRERFDVVHVEQLQALAGAAPAVGAGAACVLRAQNVESAVWADAAHDGAGGVRRLLSRALLRVEARRLRRFEAAALATADVTIALSPTDATRLAALNPAATVVVIPPPFPMDSGGIRGERQADQPAGPGRIEDFVWIGSPSWPPNEDGLRWLVESVWAAIAARVPGARLHVFGASPSIVRRAVRRQIVNDSIVWHAAPDASREAFGAGTILLLPLRIRAGVRMRLLEAWARGVPAIASPAAVDGLDTADGRDVLVASSPDDFARAAARLTADPGLRAALAAGGRATLARHHDAITIAHATLAVYHQAIARRRQLAPNRAHRPQRPT